MSRNRQRISIGVDETGTVTFDPPLKRKRRGNSLARCEGLNLDAANPNISERKRRRLERKATRCFKRYCKRAFKF